MDKKSPSRRLQLEFGFLVFPGLMLLFGAGMAPYVLAIATGEALKLFYWTAGFAATGMSLLFLCRLPLYRAGTFSTFAPPKQNRLLRLVFWLGVVGVLISVGLLGFLVPKLIL